MTHKYKVSAIVSTYKSERFIRGCLEDLIEQTLYQQDQLEIIVIDSNSPENEAEIVKEFQAAYPHIIYQRTPERETLYAAWNRAIKLSSGEYITNANTDDRHRPDALAVLALTLDQNSSADVVYAHQLVNSIPNQIWETAITCRYLHWPPYSKDRLCQGPIIGAQPVWRKSVHQQWGYFDDTFQASGDYEFWLRIAQDNNMFLVPDILGIYHENPFSLERTGNGAMETQLLRERYGISNLPAPPSTMAILTLPQLDQLSSRADSESMTKYLTGKSLVETFDISCLACLYHRFGNLIKLNTINILIQLNWENRSAEHIYQQLVTKLRISLSQFRHLENLNLWIDDHSVGLSEADAEELLTATWFEILDSEDVNLRNLDIDFGENIKTTGFMSHIEWLYFQMFIQEQV